MAEKWINSTLLLSFYTLIHSQQCKTQMKWRCSLSLCLSFPKRSLARSPKVDKHFNIVQVFVEIATKIANGTSMLHTHVDICFRDYRRSSKRPSLNEIMLRMSLNSRIILWNWTTSTTTVATVTMERMTKGNFLWWDENRERIENNIFTPLRFESTNRKREHHICIALPQFRTRIEPQFKSEEVAYIVVSI